MLIIIILIMVAMRALRFTAGANQLNGALE